MTRPALAVSELSARRGTRDVLDLVSFTANPHEILGVIGPNGAGKTTLFECVAGVLPYTRGSVNASGPLFYIADAIRPWPDQTVRWSLELNARVFNTRVDPNLIDALGLEKLLDQRTHALSKGEAKRMNIALGLSVAGAVILLDEPFDGLDLRQTRAAAELLREYRSRALALVVSIHQLTDAARVCDRFLLLDHGRGVAEGTLEDLQTQSGVAGALEDVFLALT
ncbi:MAG TPA: ABC transporter ATP-binding protein [Thermoanaerobaculia bacterium]|nr:ABC transporter ATP-binding protein [Thermoanaerobaculia bacterium]